MNNISGKIAVVTGASKGIGVSIAKHLAAEGASVVVNYASSREGADKVVADITAAGGKAIAIVADVTRIADIDMMISRTTREFGRIDFLHNNAFGFSANSLPASRSAVSKCAPRRSSITPDGRSPR